MVIGYVRRYFSPNSEYGVSGHCANWRSRERLLPGQGVVLKSGELFRRCETWRTEDGANQGAEAARENKERAKGKPLAVVVIPLLFETRAESEFDAVICVACSAATQRQRLLERGWSAEQVRQRIAAQLPVEENMLRSHYVVWTEAGMDVHAQRVYRIVPQA